MRIIQGMHLLTNAKKSSKRACLHSFELKHTPKYYGIGRFSQQTVSKHSKNCKNVLSLLDHTRVGQPDNQGNLYPGACSRGQMPQIAPRRLDTNRA